MVPVLSIWLIARLVAAVILWVAPDAGLTQESEIVADGKQEFQRYCDLSWD
jgi:hypothetical protein